MHNIIHKHINLLFKNLFFILNVEPVRGIDNNNLSI